VAGLSQDQPVRAPAAAQYERCGSQCVPPDRFARASPASDDQYVQCVPPDRQDVPPAGQSERCGNQYEYEPPDGTSQSKRCCSQP
jgi:hypothetical protein